MYDPLTSADTEVILTDNWADATGYPGASDGSPRAKRAAFGVFFRCVVPAAGRGTVNGLVSAGSW